MSFCMVASSAVLHWMASCYCLSDPYMMYWLYYNSLQKTENNVVSSSLSTLNLLLSKGFPAFFLGRGDKKHWFAAYSRCYFQVFNNVYTKVCHSKTQKSLTFRDHRPYQLSSQRGTLTPILINYKLGLLIFLRQSIYLHTKKNMIY